MRFLLSALLASILLFSASPSFAGEFLEPWRNKSKALIIDAYEFNPINWDKMLTDKRIAAFISKASDGLPPRYRCRGGKKSYEFRYCRLAWRKYSVTKELYNSRRHIAKSRGLKWGSYHLGRAGNPIRQADHYLEFANPQPDEMMVIDLETMNTKKYMSFAEAEQFVKRIHERTGRYPVLYANGDVTKWLVLDKKKYPLLSRLKLWYARYRGDIRRSFPKGNWDSYLMWQFAYHGNCNRTRCPYRVPGTPNDIDVNVAWMSVDELKGGWPFDGLVPERDTSPDEVIEEELLASDKKSHERTEDELFASLDDDDEPADPETGIKLPRYASIIPQVSPRRETISPGLPSDLWASSVLSATAFQPEGPASVVANDTSATAAIKKLTEPTPTPAATDKSPVASQTIVPTAKEENVEIARVVPTLRPEPVEPSSVVPTKAARSGAKTEVPVPSPSPDTAPAPATTIITTAPQQNKPSKSLAECMANASTVELVKECTMTWRDGDGTPG